MDQTRAGWWTVTVCLVLAVTHAPVLAGVAMGGHGSPVNATAVWTPTTPGATNSTVTAYATAADDANLSGGYEIWENFTTIIPAPIGTTTCGPHNVRAAGIDRNDDDPGTEADVEMLGRFKYYTQYENDAGQTVLTIVFFDEDDFGGNPVYLNHTDEIVARIADCFDNPTERGWYRNYGHTNGTDWHGEYAESDAFSHWYYFCECESYDAAVETIGPPPTVELASSDQSVGRMAGPYYLSEPRPDNQSQGATATPTPTAEPTATATSASTATATSSPTRTDRPATDAEPTPTPDESTASPTETTTPTPGTTAGAGPGVGIGTGLIAALLTTVLARRRG